MSLGMVFLLFFASTVPFVAGKSLLKLKIEADRSSYKGCSQTGVESCVPANLDIDLLKTGDSIEIPDGTELMLSHRSHNSAVFQNGAAEAVFTWAGVHVAGQVHANGNSWALEGCGEGCFLWIKQKNDWLDEATAPTSNHKKGFFQVHENMKKLQDQGLLDTTTEVTYSVMIWYTPQFYALFATEADMNVFVDLIFAETNQGYINSQMPVRVSKLGPQLHPTLVDIDNSSALVNNFEDSMPQHELLNCADAAALLINDFSSCGIAKFGTTSSCRTFSVTKKSCATGYYSFGHEIGHNFGATHNPEQFSSTSGDGYAHLILPTGPSKYTGYRTILGYNADGHYNRVNYYSNPDVIFPTTGTATGVTDLSNNARVISANRFAMAACGTDEPNGVCNDCSINPAAEICLTCCDTVTLSSTNADFLNSGYSVFAGTYSVYTDNPTVNDRKVYKLDGSSTAYCLFYAVGRWAIATCDNVGSGSYYVKSADTSKKCVHGVTNWQWSSTPDPTMTVECPGSCVSDPPSPPSGVNSDWDGSSKNAGTIVTYSCSSSDSTKKSVCDPNTLTWNPATIPSDLCSDSSTTTTRTSSTTTTTTTESTTTTETTTTTSTTTTTTTTTTTSTTTEANIKCVDQGCMDSFQGDGECVDTLTLDWSSLDTAYDLQAGTKDGKCSITCNCQCLKKKMCPIESKKCMKKKGQCVSPSSTPLQGWYYAGFLCDTKNKCKCYQQCKSSGCEKKKGVCLIPTADTIPFGFKMKGACNKKAKCFCYVPICSPTPSCSNKGGKCYGKGMSVPSGAKYLGWCSKSQKCKCYKVEATTTTTTPITTTTTTITTTTTTTTATCSTSQITIPATFIGIDAICIDKMDIILMRDSDGKVEGYNANGACGLNSIAQLPETRQGGGLAYVGERLISFGGWKGGYGHPNTWEYSFATNTWISIEDMAGMSHTSYYYDYTQTAIGFNTLGQELAFYFASPELQTFDPSLSTWTLQKTGINNILTMGVVSVGHYLIILSPLHVWKYNPNTNTIQQLPSIPTHQCYYPKAAILDRTSGVGIMVVCTDGRTFFCLLDRLEWQTPSGWNALPSVDPTTTSGTMLAYVEGKMHCLRGGNAWQWDDANETWLAAPGGYTAYQQNRGRTTYTTIPKNLVPDC